MAPSSFCNYAGWHCCRTARTATAAVSEGSASAWWCTNVVVGGLVGAVGEGHGRRASDDHHRVATGATPNLSHAA
jgi:hypothetical protein